MSPLPATDVPATDVPSAVSPLPATDVPATDVPGAPSGDGPVMGGSLPAAPSADGLVASAPLPDIERSGASNTLALLAALRGSSSCAPGTPPPPWGMGRFPVGGAASYIHDWHFPRSVPVAHLHEGTDIFAVTGTPVRAPADGLVRISDGPVGGLAVYVTTADGTYFYMAHLSATAANLTTGQTVRTGDVVGAVGTSGNARGGAPHVHFEVHPGGGEPVDPKAILDRWLDEATVVAGSRPSCSGPVTPDGATPGSAMLEGGVYDASSLLPLDPLEDPFRTDGSHQPGRAADEVTSLAAASGPLSDPAVPLSSAILLIVALHLAGAPMPPLASLLRGRVGHSTKSKPAES